MRTLAAISGRLGEFVQDDAGPTAVEYAIMLALIVLVSVAAIQGIGSRVINIYNSINETVPT